MFAQPMLGGVESRNSFLSQGHHPGAAAETGGAGGYSTSSFLFRWPVSGLLHFQFSLPILEGVDRGKQICHGPTTPGRLELEGQTAT